MMQVSENSDLFFTEKIPSNSRVVNPLGIWYHLNIQDDFVPGITSVTRRARYYTLLAWYYENLYKDKIIGAKDFEKIFILSSLAHHQGNYSDPALLHVFNKQKFKDRWDDIEEFDLDFSINGFGRTYYTRQLEVFRCAWEDKFENDHFTKLNSKLASSLDPLPVEAFEKETFTKEYLRENFSRLCICNMGKNEEEVEMLSKLFFGFFSKRSGEWKIDEKEFENFENGKIDLDFDENFQKKKELDQNVITREKSLKRRNTLFLFLKIISETNPDRSDFSRTLWDAIYFCQKRDDKEKIDFGKLEKVRKYWEYFQLNLYYIYSIEILLDLVQNIVRKNPDIERENIIQKLNKKEIEQEIKKNLDVEFETLEDILNAIEKKNKTKETNLDCPINESYLFSKINESDNFEEKIAFALLLLLTLRFRYEKTSKKIKKYNKRRQESIIEDKINIRYVMKEIVENKDLDLIKYLENMIERIIRRHLFEAAKSLHRNTKSWLFIDQEGKLFFARKKPINIHSRDNRWGSLRTLLKDLNFLDESDGQIKITEKGETWLQRIE